MLAALAMNIRAFPLFCWFALALSLLGACQSSPPASTEPPLTASGWASVPAFEAGLRHGQRFHVTCEDPARSSKGAQLAQAFAESLAAKGYVHTENAAEADFLCVLVVRYCGRTVPPDGQLELITQAGDTILGGDESWLAADGSGYDTKARKARAVRFRSGVRSKMGEMFRGHQDDQWTLLVDVAIGARMPEQRQALQRHEGRVWASMSAHERAMTRSRNSAKPSVAPSMKEESTAPRSRRRRATPVKSAMSPPMCGWT